MKFFLRTEEHIEDGKFNETQVCIYDVHDTSEFSFINEMAFYDDEKYVPFLVKNLNKVDELYTEPLMEGEYDLAYITSNLKKVLSADIEYYKNILQHFKERQTKIIITDTFPKTFLKYDPMLDEKWSYYTFRLLKQKKFVLSLLKYENIPGNSTRKFTYVNTFLYINCGFNVKELDHEQAKEWLERSGEI